MTQGSEKRALDLIIDGIDISEFVDEWANCKETRAEWTVRTGLISNNHTAGVLAPLTNQFGQSARNVWVEYRLRVSGRFDPWNSGYASITWRLGETGKEELILHGVGRLEKEKATQHETSRPVSAKIVLTTSVGGEIIQKDESLGTITFGETNSILKEQREEHIRLIQESEINAFTSPEFVLFLADSANSSFRLLYTEGFSHRNDGLHTPP